MGPFAPSTPPGFVDRVVGTCCWHDERRVIERVADRLDQHDLPYAFRAFKSQLKGDSVVLRSKTPDGAEQELWALLCAYHAIRELICAAAELTDQDPLRISFIAAPDAVRGPVGDPAALPPNHPPGHFPTAWLHILAALDNQPPPARPVQPPRGAEWPPQDVPDLVGTAAWNDTGRVAPPAAPIV